MKISGIVIAYNAQETIAQTLESLSWANEVIVVIDTITNDKTEEICQKFPCRILNRRMDTYGAQRNFAIDQATNDWIFTLDSDEFLSAKLISTLKSFNLPNNVTAFDFLRINQFMGRWIRHGDWGNDFQTRLFNRKFARYDEQAAVHENLIFTIEKRKKINDEFYHFTYGNLQSFIQKLGRYATNEAIEWLKKNKKFYTSYIFLMPLQRFFKGYIQRKGFLDGFEGLIHALFQGVYIFVKFLKVREILQEKKNERP